MALKPVDFVAILALPSFRMPLLPTAWKVAVPFSGIDAVGAAIEKRKLLAQVVNHVEKNARLLEYLRGVTGNPQLQATDALLMQLSDLVPSNVLFTGPPCEPWAAGGGHAGWDHCLADCMRRTIGMAAELDAKGELLVVCIENSPCLAEPKNFRILQALWLSRMGHKWLPLRPVFRSGITSGVRMLRNRAFFMSWPYMVANAVDNDGNQVPLPSFEFKKPMKPIESILELSLIHI